MLRTLTLVMLALLGLLAPTSAAQQVPWKPGVVTDSVQCTHHPDQSYALYVPSQYSISRSWPIVYAFDPGAHGALPVEAMKEAAERYGYIVAGSNNSQNGPPGPEKEAAKAVTEDTFTRFAVDQRRMYFAGFSGGARLAASLALNCKCAAGVFLSGAGLPQGVTPSRDNVFPLFAAVGSLDFNYGELVQLDRQLEAAGFPHFLRRFEGPHQWAPAEVWQDAFAWSELQAIKDRYRPRDDAFIASELARATSQAAALEQSGELYVALQNYRQLISAFSGLADTKPLEERLSALEKDKRVAKQQKAETEEIAAQQRRQQSVLQAVYDWDHARSTGSPNTDDLHRAAEQAMHDLIEDDLREKRSDQKRVLARARTGVFVNLVETGEARLSTGNALDARRYFELAEELQPDWAWPHVALARSFALAGDKKAAINALHKARLAGLDQAGLTALLQHNPALAALQQEAHFREQVLDVPAPPPHP